jgi:large conductance mechanosensitive channel
MDWNYWRKEFLNEFQEFATHGKAVDIAIGTILGAGVTPVANSIVEDIVLPPVGLVIGRADLPNLYLTLREGEKGGPYKTLSEAQEDGAITINYGKLINRGISLVVILMVAFGIVKGINILRKMQEQRELQEKQKQQAQLTTQQIQTLQQQEQKLPPNEINPDILVQKARSLDQLRLAQQQAVAQNGNG